MWFGWIALLPVLYGHINAKPNYAIDINFCNAVHRIPEVLQNIKTASYKKNGLTTLDVSFDLLINLTAFRAEVSFNILRKDAKNINLLHSSNDGCRSLEGTSNNNLVRNIIHEMRRYSNIPKKCPMLAQHYYFANMTFNKNNLPPMMPEMNWEIEVQYFNKEMFLGDFVTRGTVRKLK